MLSAVLRAGENVKTYCIVCATSDAWMMCSITTVALRSMSWPCPMLDPCLVISPPPSPVSELGNAFFHRSFLSLTSSGSKTSVAMIELITSCRNRSISCLFSKRQRRNSLKSGSISNSQAKSKLFCSAMDFPWYTSARGCFSFNICALLQPGWSTSLQAKIGLEVHGLFWTCCVETTMWYSLNHGREQATEMCQRVWGNSIGVVVKLWCEVVKRWSSDLHVLGINDTLQDLIGRHCNMGGMLKAESVMS